MKKQMYRLTAKNDYKDESTQVKKGDSIFTCRPENYDLEHFEVTEWDEKQPL